MAGAFGVQNTVSFRQACVTPAPAGQ
jgi:hypothetical protein